MDSDLEVAIISMALSRVQRSFGCFSESAPKIGKVRSLPLTLGLLCFSFFFLFFCEVR
jgi:hypothetical protein